MTRLTSDRKNSRNLLVMIELRSANPKREWSVNTVGNPIILPINIASPHRPLNA